MSYHINRYATYIAYIIHTMHEITVVGTPEADLKVAGS